MPYCGMDFVILIKSQDKIRMSKKTHRGSRGSRGTRGTRRTRKVKRSKSRSSSSASSRSKSASPHKWENLNVEFMMNLPPNAILPHHVGRYSSNLLPIEPLLIESSPVVVDVVPAYSPSLSPNAEEWVPFQPPAPKSSPPLLSARAPVVNLSRFALAPITSPRPSRTYTAQPWTLPPPPPELWLPLLYDDKRIYLEQFKTAEEQAALMHFFEFFKDSHDLHLWTSNKYPNHPYIYKGHRNIRNTRNNRSRSAFNVPRGYVR